MTYSSHSGYSATRFLSTPYSGISPEDYSIEKRRLQLEMLKIQTEIADSGQRICLLFDGRDAAGKGSAINRFSEKLMPQKMRIVQFGVPTAQESKRWLNRYKKKLPKKGEIVLFDRSWYNRALIEPTMGYCSKSQYRYFMKNVLPWELDLIDNGLQLIKFYLSVDIQTQLIRFQHRLSDPLTYWKISPNDFQARKKWETFTKYKEQMFQHTSSPKSPWVVISSKSKPEARLTCMLHFVRLLGDSHFEPYIEKDKKKKFSIEINGTQFQDLDLVQFETLKKVANQASKKYDINVKLDNIN